MDLKTMNHPEVRLSATRCFGRFCGFLHPGDSVLRLCFNTFVVGGLIGDHSEETRDAAVQSWRLFCHHFRRHQLQLPSTFTESMYNIYVQSMTEESSQVNNEQTISIMIGLMTIFTSFNNLKETKTSIAYLMKLPYRHLSTLNAEHNAVLSGSTSNIESIVESVKRISTIFEYCKLSHLQFQLMVSNNTHLSMKLLLKIWPQLCYLFQVHHHNEQVMKWTVNCIKYVICECPGQYAQSKLFHSVLKDVIALYCKGSLQSSFLNLISVYLNEYPDEPTITNIVSMSFNEIASATLGLLDDDSSFGRHHQTVEGMDSIEMHCNLWHELK